MSASAAPAPNAVAIHGPAVERRDEILSPAALAFLADLHHRFDGTPPGAARRARPSGRSASTPANCPISCAETKPFPRRRLDGGADPRRPPRPARRDHRARRPQDDRSTRSIPARKVFMADFEDASSPTWANMIEGQTNLKDRWAGTIDLRRRRDRQVLCASATSPPSLLVRPRGWHLDEDHLTSPASRSRAPCSISASTSSTTPSQRSAKGSTPVFYLPKLESHLEARLWNEVFTHAEERARRAARGRSRRRS